MCLKFQKYTHNSLVYSGLYWMLFFSQISSVLHREIGAFEMCCKGNYFCRNGKNSREQLSDVEVKI